MNSWILSVGRVVIRGQQMSSSRSTCYISVGESAIVSLAEMYDVRLSICREGMHYMYGCSNCTAELRYECITLSFVIDE